MKTTLVFVATDSAFSLLRFSSCSARIHNPTAKIIVVTDTVSKPIDSHYFDDVVRVGINGQFNEMERSRWLKTTLREHISGDFLYVDCDTIICEDLSDIDNLTCNIGGVLDQNRPVGLTQYHSQRRFAQKFKQAFDFDFTEKEHYINGGVLYVKDNEYTHNFFHTWHQNWLISLNNGVHFDQPALYKTELECGKITEISGIWNCQFERNISYFYDAKILHLFAYRIDTKLIPVFGCNPFDVTEYNDDFLDKLAHFKSLFINKSAMIILGEKTPKGRTFYTFKSRRAQKIFMLIYKLFFK